MRTDSDAYAAYEHLRPPGRDPQHMREVTRDQWRRQAGARGPLWVFGYASLIWRPDFDPAERHPTRVHGWHRALAMWSRVNRGTPEQPGLVFALLPGGSCQGVVYRVPTHEADAVFDRLWAREMPSAVYDPRWLACSTPHGPVQALAFTLSRRSPSYTGALTPGQYRDIFRHAHGRYGSTLDYARQTLDSLHAHGVKDLQLSRLLHYADE
ncbi:gamma-glutamylcyclotransferase [Ottowia pentelensis]|uniref:glutathione-specific gamma-glutamylcyclotransferase n=1 Tax=Ottowia pentelensis TaxID=511108 RepID=A0ABV6PS66_9BURK